MDLDAISQKLAASAVDLFVEVSGVPRPSGHCEAIRAFLTGWAREHGLVCGEEGGNVWIDVPAAAGYEDKPKVIVQGHMDMVCVADPDVVIDFQTQPVTLAREGDVITAKGTTLGADDGVGLAFGLALAALGEGHGPLRVLATYDEETTMAGAMAVTSEVLDADYIVNVDMGTLGTVVVSSAGVLEGTFRTEYPVQTVAGEASFEVYLNGFAGGHSGGQIHRGLANAIDGLADALASLAEAGIPARIVYFGGGMASNAIPAAASATFSVAPDQADAACEVLGAALRAFVASHPEEAGSYEIDTILLADAVGAPSFEDSARFLGFVRSLPRGVIAMSSVVQGLVQTSNNLGVALLRQGKAELTVLSRSCEDADLTGLRGSYDGLAQEYGMVFADPLTIPAWPARAENRLCDLMMEGYALAGIEAGKTAVHGGLEPSWFCRTKPGLQMVSCGPTSWGHHSTGEGVDVSSFVPFAKCLLHTLQNI